jgi:Family of unknown function (DUF6169)
MATSLQPYKYKVSKAFYYSFKTDNGFEYVCYFTPFGDYFHEYPEIAPKIFSFDIELKNTINKPRGTDKRIADTVIEIVGEFLMSQINAVVYICDPSDGKGNARFKKFQSWVEYYTHESSQIVQISDFLETDSGSLHAVLLVHKKNKLREQFVKAFFNLNDGDK